MTLHETATEEWTDPAQVNTSLQEAGFTTVSMKANRAGEWALLGEVPDTGTRVAIWELIHQRSISARTWDFVEVAKQG